jgi:magnesium transporter
VYAVAGGAGPEVSPAQQGRPNEMVRFMERRSRKAGLPPGTPVHIGEAKTAPVRITLFDYNEEAFEEREIQAIEECSGYADRPTVTWVNVDGVHDVKLIESIGAQFGIHPLVLEDIANPAQRPKVDEYEGCLYIVLHMFNQTHGPDGLDWEQVSIILGRHFVVSFQERPGDVFDAVRDRIRTGKGRVRKMGPDYLVYSLMDAVIDGYFMLCESLVDRTEPLHDELIQNATPASLQKIHELKSEVHLLRRSIWPLREVISNLERNESGFFRKDTRVYLRDVYDHTIQVIDTIETHRDMVGGMVDLYLSSVSNRMNEVMKVLTIIATIFIPLGFIAGLYGMNFQDMPELHWRLGYPAALLLMATVAGGMLYYFRRNRWI